MRRVIQRALQQIPHPSAPRPKKIYLALSGGVDSSVAAFLLKERGYSIQPIIYKSWDLHDELASTPSTHKIRKADIDQAECSFERDVHDAERVVRCLRIESELRVWDFVGEYWNEVFVPEFLERLVGGGTPSPDLVCNRVIKFGSFLRRVKALSRRESSGGDGGVSLFATGHYARLRYSCDDRKNSERLPLLLRAVDHKKDQTYFLAALHASQLKHAVFPVGSLYKEEVRAIAKHVGIPVATKRSSRGICFIGKRRLPEFVSKYVEISQQGSFVDFDSGEKLGVHSGVPYQYTIGQGAKIGGCEKKF